MTRAVDGRGPKRISLPQDATRAELLDSIRDATASIAAPDVDRLAIAVPGPFDYATGVSRITHKLAALFGVDLRTEVAHAAGVEPASVRFLNDGEAFALGEWWAGAARGSKRVLGITLGTGLGSAFVDDGRIVRSGRHVPPGGALHELSFRGTPVESTISSRGLLGLYDAASSERIAADELAARATMGEPSACRAFEELGRALGEFLTPWLVRFETRCLVVGGSIARSWPLFEGGLRRELEPIPPLETVTVAERLDDAPLLGAAWYVVSPEY
jgi:glucokinase